MTLYPVIERGAFFEMLRIDVLARDPASIREVVLESTSAGRVDWRRSLDSDDRGSTRDCESEDCR